MPSSNLQLAIFRAAILLTIAGPLAACSAGPSGGRLLPVLGGMQAVAFSVASEGSLYPLTAGLRWDYDLIQKQADGSIKVRQMGMGVAASWQTALGVTEARLERAYGVWAPPATRAVSDTQGVSLSRAADAPGGPSLQIIKLPADAGARWPGRPLTGGNAETVVVRGEEDIEVPAGKFRAIHVDHEITYANGDGDVLSYWYAPGSGCVRMIERTTIAIGGVPQKLAVEGVLTKLTPDTWPKPVGLAQAPVAEGLGLLPQRIR
jgi:hypothetical protein